ncbi:MAG: hypothetical protein OCC49_17770 [Fibrobacterales bacterium]
MITGGIHLSYCAGKEGCDATHECELGVAYTHFEEMKAKYNAPVVWMGDLNRWIGTTIFDNIFTGTIGTRNSFIVEDLSQAVGGTMYNGESWQYPIDHILGEPGYFERMSGGRTQHGVKGQWLENADHFPVYSELRWEVEEYK